MRQRLLPLLLPLAATLAVAPLRAADDDCDVKDASRVVAIGDIHGAYREFVGVLRLAQLVDDKEHWSGGRTHLVQTGDILDRGSETRPALELLMRLLTTGVRTPVGMKIYGADLAEIERLGGQVEAALRDVPGTRSAFAERAAGGYFVDLELRRDEIARYGLSVAAVQDVVTSAIGGENVTTTVEGRARFPVNVRYPRDLRSDLETLGRVLVMTPGGAQVPLVQLADIRTVTGPSIIRNENGLLVGYVYVDITGRDVGGYVEEASLSISAGVASGGDDGLVAYLPRPPCLISSSTFDILF